MYQDNCEIKLYKEFKYISKLILHKKGGEGLRFNVELLLKNESFPKDKNRVILSLLKHNFNSYNEDYYLKLYKETPTNTKDFTFSLFMKDCKFLRDEIVIPDKKILLNFSTYSIEEGITFYNSFLQNKGLEYKIKNNTLKIGKINLIREKAIKTDEVLLKTLSPISVREHNGDNKTTWYHSLNDDKGKEVFLKNFKHQFNDIFGNDRLLDSEELEIEILRNKEVKVKHYGIEVLGNISTLKIKGKPYILDYIYKAGIGSQRSAGFGMIDLV